MRPSCKGGWAIAILFGLGSSPQALERRACSAAQAEAAERAAGGAKTWQDLYQAYLAFAQCDDGSVSEGFSDSVGRLLAGSAAGLSDLAHLARRDGKFLEFALRHVDTTIPRDRTGEIERNTRARCPESADLVCQRVLRALYDLSQELALACSETMAGGPADAVRAVHSSLVRDGQRALHDGLAKYFDHALWARLLGGDCADQGDVDCRAKALVPRMKKAAGAKEVRYCGVQSSEGAVLVWFKDEGHWQSILYVLKKSESGWRVVDLR